MTCHELEALRLGLMNVLGIDDRDARKHAKAELGEQLEGPIEGLANAENLAAIERHLDSALVDLEGQIAATDATDPEYDYLRGRLIAVRDAEQAIHRVTQHGESVFDGLGETHDVLHETFPGDE
jgi:hypothetical protein